MRYAQLFDGTKLSFPDDTPDEVINRVAREETLKRNAPPVQAPIAPSTERTTGQAIGDLGASFITGTGRLLAVPGQLIALGPGLRGIGSAVSAPGEAIAEFGEGLKSQGLKVREALRSQAISEAEKDGILSEFATAIKETIKDPGLLSSFLTEQIPNLIPTAFVGRLFAKLGISAAQGLTGEAAEQAIAQAQRRGVTAAVGTGAAMQSADISSEAYKQAYEAAIAQGKPPEQAESEANNAARIAAGGAFGISLATQKLPGARAIEQRLIGAPGGVSRVVGGLGEATAESLEEAGGALFQNIGIRTVDPNQSLTQGVGAAAGLGLLGGGFFGTLLSKKATPEPLPGQLPGETIEQSILRLVTERESLKTPPVPESIIPDVDVIKLAGSLDEKGNPIGYALLTQYEERLKQLPESPERDQALQVASSVKERLNIESIQRQQNAYQNIITYKDMKDLGFTEADPLYEALVGKNLGAPDDATKVIETLNKELEQDIPSQRRELVGVMLEQVQGFLDQVPGSGFYAPRTDQRADGAGASVSDQLGAGTPGGPQAPSDASLDASTGLPGKRDEGEGAQPSSLGASKKSLRPALTNLKSDIEAQLKDWRSKVYKPNEQAVFLKGDGPSNREMLKIGQINESRRQSAIENLTQDLNAIRRIQDQIKTEAGLNEFLMRVDGVYQRANQIVEEGTTDFANPGDLFEYLLLNEDLKIFPPRRGAYSSNSVSKAIRAIVEQRKAAADQIRAAEEERRASAKVEGQTQQDVDEESADYLMMLFGAEPEDKKLSLADVQKIPESKFREIEQRAKKPSKPAQPKAEEPPSTDKLRIDQINKELETLMKRLLSKYGLKDVSVQIVKDMAAKGEFSGRLIKLADDTDNPLVDLRHEAIHALKELGFFTPAQWETLKNKAAQEWVQTYLKDAPYTDKVSRYEAYKQMFEAEGKNPQEVEEALIEEAIADAFSYFNKTRAPSGLMASINFRLKNLFKALKQFLTDSGLSAEDIFGRIEEGKLPSKAEAKAAEPPKASLRDTPKIDRQRSLNDKRISPRFPTAVKATEDVLAAIRLQPDLATFKRDPDAFRYNIGLMSKYPNFTDIKGTPNQRAEQIINRLKDNLLWLYNSWDTNLRDRSKLWYVGGNRIAHRWAQKYGIPPETAAAIIASLSPQKDWFQNVSLAERTLDAIVFNADFRWDAAMDRVFKERAWTKKFPVKQYRGKTLKEMYVPGDPKSLAKMAVWIRAWDEGHNPQTARVITPEGTFTNEIASGKTGAPIAMRAQSFAAMVKTLQIMQDSNLENFSNLIGKNHKVRSFYNNIIAPFAGDDVTIDTHAVAAALMRPLGSSDLEVYHNFGSAKPAKKDKEGNILVKAGKGTKNSAVTGLYGTYAIYAEAYRRAAQEVGVFPREMQSITWEAIRGLFRPEQKQARLKSQVDALWNKVAKGEINAEDARQQISKLVSGIEDPAWVKSPAGSNESRTDSSYATELPGDRVPGREPERLPGGARERVARVRSKVKYSLKNINVESNNFKQWSNNAPVIPAQDTRSYKGGPAVFQAFHGSTYGDITVFDTERGDREGFLGAGPYLSTSVDDVNANYAGIGPDLTNKISRAEEDFADGFTDSYSASEMLQDYFDDNDLDIEVTDDNFDQLSEDYRDKAITHAAIKSLKGKSDGVVVPAYVRLLKPFDMRGDKGTNFTYEQKYDEDGEPVGEPTGTSMELIDAIRSVASTYNADADRLISEIYDNPDGISAKEVFDLAQKEFSGLYDDNGDLVSSGQVVQEIAKEMGFDGIIQPANDYFGSARPAVFGIRPKGMQGVYPDTLHLMPFSSDQIKSSVGNIGTFGQRAPTEEEAKRLGMSAADAAKAQKSGDIRLSLRSERSPLGFYSELENKIADMGPNQAPPAQWKTMIKALPQKGVKPDEIEWSGVNDWLDLQEGKVKKADLIDYLKANGVQVEEVVLGDPRRRGELRIERSQPSETWSILDEESNVIESDIPDRDTAEQVLARLNERGNQSTKYEQYVIPGGKNYREVVITLPQKEIIPDQKEVDRIFKKRQEVIDRYAPTLNMLFSEMGKARGPENRQKHDQLRAHYDEISAELDSRLNEISEVPQKTLEPVKYQSKHWNQPNVLAHIRMDDRTDTDGNKVLFVEEIQSDWGQEGKKKGFTLSAAEKAEKDAEIIRLQTEISAIQDAGVQVPQEGTAFEDVDPNFLRVQELIRQRDALQTRTTNNSISVAPFVTKTEGWLNLALKRIMIMATEGGYDKVAFIRGEQAAEVLSVEYRVDRINWSGEYTGNRATIQIIPVGGTQQRGKYDFDKDQYEDGPFAGKSLEEVVGKEIAQRIASKPIGGTLSGEGLKIQSTGMREFYNSIIPIAVKKLLPKVGGGQMETVEMERGKPSQSNFEKGPFLNWMEKNHPDIKREDANRAWSMGIENNSYVQEFYDSTKQMKQPGFDVTPAMREKVAEGLPKFSLRSPDTKAFKQWFGDSKVVDENGDPLVMYHGTTKDFSVFKTKNGAVFVTPSRSFANKIAMDDMLFTDSDVPIGPSGANVMPVYVRAERPFDFENASHIKTVQKLIDDPVDKKRFTVGAKSGKWQDIEDFLGSIEDAGFDSAYINEQGIKNLAVFSPNQIKSAVGNIGTFDPTNPDIRYSLRSPDTKAFKQWFNDSKVVDANNNPLVVYHGTMKSFDEFNAARAGESTGNRTATWGFFFSNSPQVADIFSGKTSTLKSKPEWKDTSPEGLDRLRVALGLKPKNVRRVKVKEAEWSEEFPSGANLMPVFLSVKNPKEISAEEFIDRFVSGYDSAKEFVDLAKQQGHDGIVIRAGKDTKYNWAGSEYSADAWVAFNPTQIKSAIGNRGTFDPANPDIRYSLRTPKQNIRSQIPQNILTRVDATIAFREDKTFARRMMDAISPRGFSWFREQAINRYEYLAKIDRKYVNRMGGVRLLADQSAEAAALFSDLGAGITASAFGVHDRVGGIPVYRNGVVQVSNQNNTIKGPLAVFAPLGKYGDPEVYRLYEFWATVKRGARLNAQGKLTPFTPADIAHAQALQARFPEFVTIQREWIKYNDGLVKFMQDTGVITPQAAQEFKQHGDYFPMYKYFEGDEVTGPKVFSSIANVAPPKKYKGDDQPLGDFFENVVRNTQAAIQAGIKNIAAQRATQVALAVGEVTPLATRPTKMTPEVYRVLENGVEKYYAANDMMMISALKSLNIPDLPLIGVFAGPANLLRNLITKTPDFMMANMLRDSLSAWVTSGKNITPVISTMINFSKAIAEKSPELNALRNAGILGGYDYAQGVEATAQTFAKDLRKISNSRTTMEKITSPVTSLWGALEKASSASDAATRMEVYKKTLAETGNEAEALFQALEIMNFNRKGRSPVIRALTAAVPFLNARIQGLDVLYRSGIRPLFAGDATAQERARAKTFFLRGATIMALSAMYWMMTHDDDEYKVQEQETRDNYWLLPSMGVKIPIPFEIGVIFKVIPERILEYSFGDDTGKDFVNAMSRQLLNTFSFNPIPQTVVPIVEAATNYSFFTTRPILGQGMEGIAPEFQATPTTSKTATAITDAYNSVIELMPDAVAKKLKASPVILEHLIQGYTGTMGMYAMQTMDYIISANSDVPNASKRFEQMPVIRRFAVDPQARGTVTAFYDMKNAVDSVTRTANYLERTMNFEDQAEFIRDNIKTLAVKDYVQSLEKTMKEFREQKVVIRSSTMSADAKRSYIDIIEKMELQLTANIRTLKKQME